MRVPAFTIKALDIDQYRVGKFAISQKGPRHWDVVDEESIVLRGTFTDLHGAICWAGLASILEVIED